MALVAKGAKACRKPPRSLAPPGGGCKNARACAETAGDDMGRGSSALAKAARRGRERRSERLTGGRLNEPLHEHGSSAALERGTRSRHAAGGARGRGSSGRRFHIMRTGRLVRREETTHSSKPWRFSGCECLSNCGEPSLHTSPEPLSAPKPSD